MQENAPAPPAAAADSEAFPEKAPDPVQEGFGPALPSASVLVIDDEPGMRNFLSKALAGSCARVDATADTVEAAALLDANSYDIVLLDNVMPRQKGVDWLQEQRRIGLFSDVILMTAFADLETAIAAIRAGASDFLLKPFRVNQLLNAISQCLARTRLQRQNAVLRHELEAGKDLLHHRNALLGSSPAIQAVRQVIGRAAAAASHVVIRGEAGSGKQIAARMLHSSSPRAGNAFVWLQCKGMSEAAFQARLFGRIEAAAEAQRPEPGQPQDGMLQDAAGGTLYLEDVDLLPPACQNILVELLTTGRFRPIGAGRSITLDVRIICSCLRPLKQAVEERSFRADLFYLLNVIEIVQPPLRERGEDVLELTAFFAETLSARLGLTPPALPPDARRRLLAHSWPGNVMELRNTVERALIEGSYSEALGAPAGTGETESLAAVEQRHILATLEACGGNRAEAARRLGIARKTIDRKCRAWGL
ncbi:sigma-54-dependent transcriptional regulator [Cribrihabitans neustonicus]|uniref:sigma-54-dependent transcriptional regulator n=1 Tax=Cribrihabitans neustonicus TaxID=1429085 RepID=UPI003B5B0F25